MHLAAKLYLISQFLVLARAQYAFEVKMTCDKGNDANSNAMEEQSLKFLSRLVSSYDMSKGNSGTLGIVVASSNYPGGVFFSAITALRFGTGNVKIFCNSATAAVLKQYSIDLSIFKTLDNNDGKHDYLNNVDVVLIGPGLDQNRPNLALIKEIINYCRRNNKTLVIDMSTWFWVDTMVETLANFPESGIVLIGNEDEFNRMYKPRKDKVDLAETKYGPNAFILRRGCMDRGISLNKKVSWTSKEDVYSKYINGQEYMLSGAVANFLILSKKYSDPAVVKEMGPTYHASIATYTATKYIRKCTNFAFQKYNRALMTTDIIEVIPDVIKS